MDHRPGHGPGNRLVIDSRAWTLDKMPDSRERELIEPTSNRKTGHQVRETGPIPQSQL